MGSPSAIRQGIATALASLVPGSVSHIYEYVPSNPTTPCVYVGDGPIDYDLALSRGLDSLTFEVTVLLAFTMDEASQQTLDGLRVSTGGVKALLEADPTLGGACSSLRVTGATGSQLHVTEGKPPACGTTWTVEVLAHP